jgi:large subunit ribosomal protein L14e
MPAIEVGRKCLLTAGRRRGEEVTITKVIDNNFVMVKGAKKERKVSVSHLDPK